VKAQQDTSPILEERMKKRFLSAKIKLILVINMGIRVKAMYEEGVLKPIEKLDLPEKAKVRITISGSFSKLLDEVE